MGGWPPKICKEPCGMAFTKISNLCLFESSLFIIYWHWFSWNIKDHWRVSLDNMWLTTTRVLFFANSTCSEWYIQSLLLIYIAYPRVISLWNTGKLCMAPLCVHTIQNSKHLQMIALPLLPKCCNPTVCSRHCWLHHNVVYILPLTFWVNTKYVIICNYWQSQVHCVSVSSACSKVYFIYQL